MKIGTTMKAAVVVNSLLLVGALIAYRTGYIHPLGYGRQTTGAIPKSNASRSAQAEDNASDPFTSPDLLRVKSGDLMVSSKSAPAVDSGNSDRLDFMVGSKSGLVASERTLALPLEIEDDTAKARTASVAPTTQPESIKRPIP